MASTAFMRALKKVDAEIIQQLVGRKIMTSTTFTQPWVEMRSERTIQMLTLIFLIYLPLFCQRDYAKRTWSHCPQLQSPHSLPKVQNVFVCFF